LVNLREDDHTGSRGSAAAEARERPDPDLLLERLKSDEARRSRASLKIFFGYAPGVGKTFAMLESARRLKAQGVDVVVGYVETHGRPETTALIEGLESLPRRQSDYRGITLAEFDIDLAISRRPSLLLLDELAHTNAPGSRHRKRWQDVLELLECGIEVHTTLNVQHIESLNDVVSQITFIKVQETVPDSILERADEIEVVDLSPEELLERLKAGKVYVPEQAGRAIEHFFRRGNLLALRELTLRRAAERIDADVLAYRHDLGIKRTWPSAEYIIVCVGPSPSSAKIIRSTRRMAAGLRARWAAVYVDAPDAHRMTRGNRERLQNHLRLAESLGGEVVRLAGRHVAEEILHFAREHNVTRIVIGKPTHAGWLDRVRGSLVSQLVRGSGDIEIHFISGDEAIASGFERTSRDRMKLDWIGCGIATLLVAVASGVGLLLRSFLSQADLVMMLLLAIMMVAFRYGRWPTILSAALSVASYDFFFVLPYYTFSVENTRHLLTFAMMFVMGIIVSSLTSRLRQQERDARLRENRTAALYSLSRELAAARDEARVAQVTALHAAGVFGGDMIVLLPESTGEVVQKGASKFGIELSAEEMGLARWVIEHGHSAGAGTDTLPGSRITCIPIQSGEAALGAFVALAPSSDLMDSEHRGFLDAVVRQAALSIERVRLTEEAEASALRIQTEETRSTLLSAVSHDLRTPLGAIVGAGSALRDGYEKLSPEQRQELCDTICMEAERMERLVSNILEMVRLESGGISLNREWIPVEEIIGSALSRLEARLGTREVRVILQPAMPPAYLDPVLFEQVLINLFDNIIKHGGPGCPIEITSRIEDGVLGIQVADRGPGLPVGTEQQVFEKFFRGPHAQAGGAGLGLSICRGIVSAHGGTISAENRPEGGALFRITLSRQSAPPIDPGSDPGLPDQELDNGRA
jgi:two-component system sensor histidine kinase KdpD